MTRSQLRRVQRAQAAEAGRTRRAFVAIRLVVGTPKQLRKQNRKTQTAQAQEAQP